MYMFRTTILLKNGHEHYLTQNILSLTEPTSIQYFTGHKY